MIENIRKYTGLMIVVLVLLFIGLVFLGDTARSSFAGKPVMEVDGVSVSQKEFQRLAVNSLEIPSAFIQSGPLSQPSKVLASHYLGDDVLSDPGASAGTILRDMSLYLQATDPGRFLANRIAVRKAGLDFGATPGPKEVEAFIENVLFADQNGKFDQVAFAEFMEKKIGRLGIGSRGFNEYVRDLLTAQNIAKILGAGIDTDSSTAATHHSLDKQSITAEQVTLDMLDFEIGLKPTEEELKAHYEENKEQYFSDELRKASYVFVEPDWDQAYKVQEEEKAKAKEAADKAAEEAKKKAAEAKAKAEADKKAAENKPSPEKATETSEVPVKPAETPEKPAEEPAKPAETPEQPAEEPAKPSEEGAEGDPGAQGEPAPSTPEKEKEETPASETEEAPEAAKEETPEVVKEETPKTEETPAENKEGDATPGKPAEKVTKPAPVPEKLPKDKLSFQNKKKAVDSMSNAVSDFFDDLINAEGKDLEEHAAKAGFTVKTTELFSKSKPAEGLDRRITSQNTAANVSTLADAIFLAPADGEADERLTYPYRTDEGWFVGRLDEVVAPVQLSFKEAKARVTVDLKKKIARENMIARAKELHEKLSAGVTEGKSFEEAAKAIDEKIVVSKQPNLAKPDLSGIPIQYRAQFGGQAPPAFDAAQFVNPGEIAEVKFTPSEEDPEKALIVFVEKREVTVSDTYSSGLTQAIESRSGLARYLAFQNWLYEQYEQNQVVIFDNEQQ